MSEKRTVRISLDPDNPPFLSDRQKMALEALAKMPDSAIDYSDIPAINENDESLYKPVKKLTSVRIDTDILAWLKTYGKGYQTKINAILRREMFAAKSGYQP
ncbi:MAG: BrnA antitoxin family protein, partial [Planctomycetota bacterium]|nr:BrnA antitoxin family protein [Planctomycetota bacterium]